VSTNEDLGRTAEEVRQRILSQISSGQLRAGQKLGAERDLASEYQVSRSTLRIALTALEETGVVRRLPGRGGGTFVSPEKIDRDL
jgi:GntR family transcriptional regulator